VRRAWAAAWATLALPWPACTSGPTGGAPAPESPAPVAPPAPAPEHSGDPTHSAAPYDCPDFRLPPPPPHPDFEACPTLDWMLDTGAGLERLVALVPLPGGDVLAAGSMSYYAWLPTDCSERMFSDRGSAQGFVIRLRPDGTRVWGHTIAAGHVVPASVTAGADGLWVVGSYRDGPLRVDGVEVGGVAGDDDSGFALAFDADGALRRSLFLDNDGNPFRGRAIVEDADGTLTLAAELERHTSFSVGPLSIPAISTSGRSDAVLLQLDPSGHPRWLTGLGMRAEDVGSADAQVHVLGLARASDRLLLGLEPWSAGPVRVVVAGGRDGTVDRGPGARDLVVPVDHATGVVGWSWWRTPGSVVSGIAPYGTAAARVVGWAPTPNTWTDASGVAHPFDHPTIPGASVGVDAVVGPDGAPVTFETTGLLRDLTAVASDGAGGRWLGGSSLHRPLGTGTDREWAPPEGVDVLALHLDAAGAFRCGVGFSSDGATGIQTIVRDELGGVWIGGWHGDGFEVVTPDGPVARADSGDGIALFLVRFAPAP
jgi:hypothetical protein